MNRVLPPKDKGKDKAGFVTGSSLLSLVLSLVFLGLSILLVVNSVKSISSAYQRNQLLAQANEEVRALRLRNLELQGKLEDVTDLEYVEEEARNRMLYSKSGEVMIVLPESGEIAGEKSVNTNRTGSWDTPCPDSGWLRWWNVLVNGV